MSKQTIDFRAASPFICLARNVQHLTLMDIGSEEREMTKEFEMIACLKNLKSLALYYADCIPDEGINELKVHECVRPVLSQLEQLKLDFPKNDTTFKMDEFVKS